MGRHKKLADKPTFSPTGGGLYLLRNGAVASIELRFPNGDYLGRTLSQNGQKFSLGWDSHGMSFSSKEWDVVLPADERERGGGVRGPW